MRAQYVPTYDMQLCMHQCAPRWPPPASGCVHWWLNCRKKFLDDNLAAADYNSADDRAGRSLRIVWPCLGLIWLGIAIEPYGHCWSELDLNWTHGNTILVWFSQLTNLKVYYNYSDSPEKELAQYSANLESIMVTMRMRANAWPNWPSASLSDDSLSAYLNSNTDFYLTLSNSDLFDHTLSNIDFYHTLSNTDFYLTLSNSDYLIIHWATQIFILDWAKLIFILHWALHRFTT